MLIDAALWPLSLPPLVLDQGWTTERAGKGRHLDGSERGLDDS